MLSKEQYKRERIRMWDKLRDIFQGKGDCSGVDCEKCPLDPFCDKDAGGDIYNAFEIIDAIEKWSREHPRKYKISPFEYEYLKLYQKHSFGSHRLCDLTGTIVLHELSYLKGIDLNVKVEDILLNCEVVEDDG